ncbi:hypothetical protein GOA97_01910 [Sinorhizobium meliloti]|nr:hypothetical protein [Sinorhizobium meliloti]MDW9653263.1 hypothetical protein [Sinorhizobium meliloti]MDW9913227.1 hypothetical protein [Sinorhizobium meliloti]MDW9940065.1 hypothetical protein [Sinorhizobium meliloti]MDW9944329.1 hypothetical protein [Sinorhizobium meliloti]
MFDQEARLTQSALLSGLEFVRASNYDKKESVYPALFQLSLGFERLMKLVIVLDHKVGNELRNPTDQELKAFGHNIAAAYEACRSIAARHDPRSAWFVKGSIEHDLLKCLSKFGKGARYYNLDQLAGSQRDDDPIVEWYEVHLRLAAEFIPHSKQVKINERAIRHCDTYKMSGWEQDWKGEWWPNVDMVFRHELFRRTRPYFVWTVIRISYPFYDLLRALSSSAHKIEEERGIKELGVPYMYEYFPFFLCNRRTSVERTRWTRIYG